MANLKYTNNPGGNLATIGMGAADNLILKDDGSTEIPGLVLPDVLKATSQQVQDMTADDVVITPKKLADAFDGGNKGVGWQKLPNGMIIQGGVVSVAGGQTTTFSFPVAFSNNAAAIVVSKGAGIAGQEAMVGAETVSRTQFRVTNLNVSSVFSGIQWMAWGY